MSLPCGLVLTVPPGCVQGYCARHCPGSPRPPFTYPPRHPERQALRPHLYSHFTEETMEAQRYGDGPWGGTVGEQPSWEWTPQHTSEGIEPLPPTEGLPAPSGSRGWRL